MFDKLYGFLRRLRYRMVLPPVALQVKSNGFTYLSYERLASLTRLLRQIKANEISGDFVEFGVALGGSAIFMASELNEARAFYGYDVFAMIPPPGEQDDEKSRERYAVISSGKSIGMNGHQYYGYMKDLHGTVCENFGKFGMLVDGSRIVLRKGRFEETLPGDADRTIALAHIDCDWYEPVRYCLGEASKRISGGGFIVVDDYNDYGGCKMAVDEFLSNNQEFRLLHTQPHAVIQRSQAAHFSP